MIQFFCPNCRAQLSIGEEHSGKQATCNHCRTKIIIPHAQSSPVSSAAPPPPPDGGADLRGRSSSATDSSPPGRKRWVSSDPYETDAAGREPDAQQRGGAADPGPGEAGEAPGFRTATAGAGHRPPPRPDHGAGLSGQPSFAADPLPAGTDGWSSADPYASPEAELRRDEQRGRSSRFARAAANRYRVAYVVATIIIVIGWIVVGIGGLILLGALPYVFNDDLPRGVSALNGLVAMWAAFGPILAGVLLVAGGQMLRAQLDQAIHSSPFLTDEQRARAMGL